MTTKNCHNNKIQFIIIIIFKKVKYLFHCYWIFIIINSLTNIQKIMLICYIIDSLQFIFCFLQHTNKNDKPKSLNSYSFEIHHSQHHHFHCLFILCNLFHFFPHISIVSILFQKKIYTYYRFIQFIHRFWNNFLSLVHINII